MNEEKAKERVAAVQFADAYDAIADADIVIEAVFESMAIKKEVFAALDKAVKKDAILASNTSTLDIDEIASATSRPEKVVGLHFFAPANVMQLLEVVRGAKTDPRDDRNVDGAREKAEKERRASPGTLSGSSATGCSSTTCAKRSFSSKRARRPMQIDNAIKGFGFPMGPFAMSDLSGIDVFYKIAQEAPKVDYRQSEISHRLYELGRYGQKTGSGFFTYEPGKREPQRDEEVERIVAAESARLGITRRTDITDEEIVKRCMYALVNEGAQLLGDGTALRPGDEDAVWIFGYGFPLVPRRTDVVGGHGRRQEDLRSNRHLARDARQTLGAPRRGSKKRRKTGPSHLAQIRGAFN